MIDPLTRLAVCYGTDKFGYHDYTPNYHKLLKHLRDQPIRMMEIGVGGYGDTDRGGQSLEVWRDFFPIGTITGIDIQEKCMDLGPRVAILQGSQVDEPFLRQVEADRGPFDVVLDDGSHQNEHIIESFGVLFPTLKDGGIYIVEDVQTSFIPRRGGSISLQQPNSVGFFADLMRRLDSTDADVASISAIERFHNIVVAHKTDPTRAAPRVFSSTCFGMFEGRAAKVVTFGRAAFDASLLACNVADVTRHGPGPISAAQVAEADIVVLFIEHDAPESTELIQTALDALRQDTVLAVCCEPGCKGFDPDGAVMNFAFQRFVEIDHREIAIHFPDEPISPLAHSIYSIERFRQGLLFHKAPNLYPSNFAFRKDIPSAARALDLMGEILASGDAREGGLVSYADMLARYVSPDSADAIIDRLTEMGATSRQYYELALARARRARDKTEILRICLKAFEAHPANSRFAAMVANAHIAIGNLEEAEGVLRSFLTSYPRSRDCVAAFTQLLSRTGQYGEAAELTRKSMALFPRHARGQRHRFLAECHEKMGNEQAASKAREAALEWDANYPPQTKS